MTSRMRVHPQARPVEVRLLIPAEQYEDLKAISKVKGLAASQLTRSIILEYLNRLYVQSATKDSTP
ncbi:hypothetical protein MKL09_14420 [Methylobacterium sp. J-048]|uniref:hypothetical protein n=1 Tax=Methylobacterium sp. J-048 TaxID=2836635 RepID=UPI001FBB703C|nr:hypothetical protein [Methylobacterium sp. J-048]MCJ2057746.1 hypothetical protein [Methylobacterium sp. J-048]